VATHRGGGHTSLPTPLVAEACLVSRCLGRRYEGGNVWRLPAALGRPLPTKDARLAWDGLVKLEWQILHSVGWSQVRANHFRPRSERRQVTYLLSSSCYYPRRLWGKGCEVFFIGDESPQQGSGRWLRIIISCHIEVLSVGRPLSVTQRMLQDGSMYIL